MGYRDYVLISSARIPKVREEGKDLGRDSVDWYSCVPPGPNQLEELENVLLEDIELK